MQPRLSPRPTPKPSPEQQAAADRAEQHAVDHLVRRRLGWFSVSIEVIAIAEAVKKQDLAATALHTRHLGSALLQLAVERST
jgi:hypothetical protein